MGVAEKAYAGAGFSHKEAAKGGEEGLRPAYLQMLHLVERLHRQLLDVIKDELERLGQTDINSVQALLLYNIGDAELTPVPLSWLERLLQPQAAGRQRLHPRPAFGCRPPLQARLAHRGRPQCPGPADGPV